MLLNENVVEKKQLVVLSATEISRKCEFMASLCKKNTNAKTFFCINNSDKSKILY